MVSKSCLVFFVSLLLTVSGCTLIKDNQVHGTIIDNSSLGGVGVFIIDEGDKSCGSDEDCVFVSNLCNDCGGDAVNKAYKGKYDSLWREACAGYEGPVCDWDYRVTHEIRCVDSKCGFVLKE